MIAKTEQQLAITSAETHTAVLIKCVKLVIHLAVCHGAGTNVRHVAKYMVACNHLKGVMISVW